MFPQRITLSSKFEMKTWLYKSSSKNMLYSFVTIIIKSSLEIRTGTFSSQDGNASQNIILYDTNFLLLHLNTSKRSVSLMYD